MSSNNAMHTERLLAHSLLTWMLATVKWEHDGSAALRNLPVTSMPSTANEEYLSEQGTWIGVHVKSRAKGSLNLLSLRYQNELTNKISRHVRQHSSMTFMTEKHVAFA